MDLIRAIVRWVLLGVLLVVAAVGPWFFGAWEMWWFWPFVVTLAGGCLLAGVALLLGEGYFPVEAVRLLLWCLPFCVYILLRWWLGDVVFLDAERTVLLHITGLLVAALVVFWMRERQLPWLFWGLFGSLFAMSLYGILNHLIADSRHVLWMPRFEQYAGRATGPYYCPDHFAGAMEFLVCMGFGLILDRASGLWRRLAGSMAIVLGTIGALMSLSRGSGMTLVVILGLVVVVGFYQWPRYARNGWRAICVFGGLFVLIGAFALAGNYRERFITYGGLDRVSPTAEESVVDQVVERLLRTSRGRMYTGAWLGWQTAPWLGVGPGMQRNLWPRFAHSGDGNRETGEWPTLVNDDFHSYEVHSDWLELLQETGMIGLLLFLTGCVALGWTYWQGYRHTTIRWREDELSLMRQPIEGFHMITAGALSFGAMVFHSLGDFNLQMPGSVWLLAALLALGIRASIAVKGKPSRSESSETFS